MNSRILNLHFTPDSTDGGGAASVDTSVADVATLPPSTTNIEEFLASVNNGALADGIEVDERPAEVLGDVSGKPIVDRSAQPSVVSQTKPAPTGQQTIAQSKGKPAPSQVQRDLTGYDPETAALLKQMSNPAFEWTAAKLKELKELSAAKAQYETELNAAKQAQSKWLFEHEDAYTLSPEYKQQAATVQMYNGEYSHWQKQLANANAGRPVYNITLNDKGQLVVEPTPIEATPEVIAEIQSNMIAASGARQEALSRLNQWKGEHTNRFQTFRSKMTGLEKQIFPQGVPESLKPDIDNAMKMFPAELQGDPLVRNLGIASVIIRGYQAQLADLQAKLNGKSAVQAAEVAQGAANPNAAATNGSRRGRTVLEELDALEAAVRE